MRYINLYFAYLKNQLMALIEYKLDFLMGLFSVLVEQIISLLFITVLFSNINSINGWSYGEILLMYSFSILGRSIHIIFFDNLWVFGSKYIQKGELDRILLRPVNPLFQIIAEKINYQGVGQIIIGVIALTISLNKLNISVNFICVTEIICLIIGSGCIYVAIHLFFMIISFWVIDSQPIVSSVFSISQFAQYPISIFPKIIRIVLLFIIPYAFTSFVPSSIFLKNIDYKFLGYLFPIIIVILLIIDYLFWKIGIKNYKSTGT